MAKQARFVLTAENRTDRAFRQVSQNLKKMRGDLSQIASGMGLALGTTGAGAALLIFQRGVMAAHRELVAMSKASAGTFPNVQLERAKQAAAGFSRLGKAASGFAHSLLSEAAPAMTGFSNMLSGALEKMTALVQKYHEQQIISLQQRIEYNDPTPGLKEKLAQLQKDFGYGAQYSNWMAQAARQREKMLLANLESHPIELKPKKIFHMDWSGFDAWVSQMRSRLSAVTVPTIAPKDAGIVNANKLVAEGSKLLANMQQRAGEATKSMQAFGTSIFIALQGGILEGEKFRDVVGNLAREIASLLTQRVLLSALGKIAPKLFGAPGFAGGGHFPADRPMIVGEKGPELLVPDRAGVVIPNHAMAAASGGPSVTVQNYNDFRGVQPESVARILAEQQRREQALKAEIADLIRRGRFPR